MRIHPKLTAVINGELFVSSAGILLLAANAMHADSAQVPADGRARGKRTVEVLLSAARAGGFKQAHILETLLLTDRESARTAELALQAMECVGGVGELATALRRAGFYPEE
ncbi:hypothetical protein [Paraburkholderia phytofirmans]|uniref:Uncharacterized protein n=1 Tax=Paraburkholderia phytofirmans TaxID=261302 RepID=A0ABW9BU88_9BURK